MKKLSITFLVRTLLITTFMLLFANSTYSQDENRLRLVKAKIFSLLSKPEKVYMESGSFNRVLSANFYKDCDWALYISQYEMPTEQETAQATSCILDIRKIVFWKGKTNYGYDCISVESGENGLFLWDRDYVAGGGKYKEAKRTTIPINSSELLDLMEEWQDLVMNKDPDKDLYAVVPALIKQEVAKKAKEAEDAKYVTLEEKTGPTALTILSIAVTAVILYLTGAFK